MPRPPRRLRRDGETRYTRTKGGRGDFDDDIAAADAGRDPSDISRIYNVWGTITDGPSNGEFDGPVDQWIDTLTGLVLDGGMNAFVFGAEGDDPAQMSAFMDRVVPAVREQVAAGRSGRTP